MSEYQVESEVKEGWREGVRNDGERRQGTFLPRCSAFDIHCIVFGMHCAVAQFRKMVEPYGAVEGSCVYHT